MIEGLRSLISDIRRVDIVLYDCKEEEIKRTSFKTKPGETLVYNPVEIGAVRLKAVTYTSEGIEVYSLSYLVCAGDGFRFIVPGPEDFHLKTSDGADIDV
jgi:hypothetical protein